MDVRVRLFGPEARLLGTGEVVVSLGPGSSIAALRESLAAQHPRLGESLAHGRFALNHEFAPESRVVEAGDEVALIGLVSGG